MVSGTLFGSFLENMRPAYGYYSVCVGDSIHIAQYFQDQSIDFCYIDASHEYKDVKADIQAWLPKMKPGGLLAGDDLNYYPGVLKAVEELLPDFVRDDNVWRYKCPSI